MEIAKQHASKSLGVSYVLRLLDLARSTFYYCRKQGRYQKRGRPATVETLKEDRIEGIKIKSIVPDTVVVGLIKELLCKEFVCYGYRKTHKALRRESYIINHKKVYRLMKEQGLLNKRVLRGRKVNRVRDRVVEISGPNELWEMDIKYIRIGGENRNAYFLAIIDCFTREVIGDHFGYSCRKEDVVRLVGEALGMKNLKEVPGRLRIRSDNGSQFIAKRVESYLEELGIEHERTHPRSPQENGHIESFNSIVEMEVVRRFEFDDFREAFDTIKRFIRFYNEERFVLLSTLILCYTGVRGILKN
jgi:putative transposase